MTTDPSPRRGFACEPAENGGWIVREERSNYEVSRVLGAFSSSADMLAYLRTYLSPPNSGAGDLPMREDAYPRGTQHQKRTAE